MCLAQDISLDCVFNAQHGMKKYSEFQILSRMRKCRNMSLVNDKHCSGKGGKQHLMILT